MRHFIHQLVIGSLAGALVAGCGAAQTPAMVKGQVNQSSFPQALTSLTVVSSTGAKTTIPVAADGTFQAKLAPGAAYRLDFLSNGSVIFPRSSGSINSAFAMVGPTTLDLGKLTYIGDPKAHTYAFTSSGTAGGTTDSSGDVEVDDSNTCQTDDGATAESGSGDATDGGSSDSAGSDTGGTSGDTASSGDATDGPDMTGAEAQQETDKIDQEPAEAAVPEHNAPSEAGCGSASSSGSSGTPMP